MRKHKEFLYSKADVIAVVITALVVFGMVFFMCNLDFSYFWIGAEIMLFLLVVYLVVSYQFFSKEVSLREDNAALREENEKLKMEKISSEKSLWEYFILWVHQMKTPVTAIRLILENDKLEDRELKIKSQLIRIEQYVDMPMAYLKIMKHDVDMDIADVELDQVIRPIIKKYSHLFIINHLRLVYEPIGISVVTDAKWMSILIEQLISNALKYTNEGQIEIFFEHQTIWVKDSGIGICSEDIPKIFDRGYSGFNGRMNEKSSGLGLYLAKGIADKLGVKIRVESEVGKGSLFGVEL